MSDKIKKIKGVSPKRSFYYGNDSIEFEEGTLLAEAYSYEIDSIGSIELNKENTYALYLAMKDYYESRTR